MPLEKMLTVKDVAEILSVDPQTVRAMLKSGYIPASKLGPLWRISPRKLELFLERRARRKVIGE